MKRVSASGRRWLDSLGIVVTILSAAMLVLAFWQVSRLNQAVGLDRATLARERVASDEVPKIYSAERDAIDLQIALARGDSKAKIAALRARADEQMASIGADVKAGPVSELDVSRRWVDALWAWQNARDLRPPAAFDSLNTAGLKLQSVIDNLEDNSNIAYDPVQAAQALADAGYSNTARAAENAGREEVAVDRAARSGAMTMKDRLAISSVNGNIALVFDLSSDNLGLVSNQLAAAMPARANSYRDLSELAEQYTYRGNDLHSLIGDHVMLAEPQTLPVRDVERVATDAIAAADKLNAASFAALDADLAFRSKLASQRDILWYVIFLIGALGTIGFIVTVAQLSARRARIALREAQRESGRLTAELARQQVEEALRLSEAQFRAVFDGAAIGIAVIDRSGSLVDGNNVFRTLFGDDIAGAMRGHEAELASLLGGERDTFEFEQYLRSGVGQDVWTDVTVSIVSGSEDTPLFAICMFRDKTELKHSERRMQHNKLHDALTGLPNRVLFEEHLRHRFEESSGLLDSFFAVLFIDLEHFKDVNESLGHAAGDLVLSQTAQRLRSSVDARDVVARLGSDEFAVLIQSLGDILHVESLARRILNNMSKAIVIGERTIYLGGSVGIAIGSANYKNAEDVMRDAEIAMHHVKASGSARFAVFDSKMHDRAEKRLQLISDIRLGLERDEFRLLYQPIVDMTDGSLAGCEALIRWQHPAQGLVNPSEFMPLAEQNGLAVAIGRFVLQTATAQLAQWRRDRNGATRDFTMHVNVSAAELLDPDFERVLVQFTEHHRVSPQELTLEITESVVLDSGTRANLTLERVRDRGFSICIDDFGTGYSSLRYLQQFEVDSIKIDRSFVSGPDGELASEPIVRTLMTLAEAFDVRVVAEGVETARQREVLRNTGCRLAQGYLYSRPISAEALAALYPDVLGPSAQSASA